MHLAERRGGRGLEIEIGEALAPVRPKLGLHAPAHERGAHRRRLRLELGQFGGEIRRHRVGDGRQHLRDLHQRALHRAQGRGERLGVRLAPAAAQPVDADPRRERAGVDAEARVAGRPRAQAIGFVVLIQTRNSQREASAKMNIGARRPISAATAQGSDRKFAQERRTVNAAPMVGERHAETSRKRSLRQRLAGVEENGPVLLIGEHSGNRPRKSSTSVVRQLKSTAHFALGGSRPA